jgi:hypothetical protein
MHMLLLMEFIAYREEGKSMAKYDKVACSKRLGWESAVQLVPSMEEVIPVIERASSSEGDIGAALTIFKWYRFSTLAETEEELTVINAVTNCFNEIFG